MPVPPLALRRVLLLVGIAVVTGAACIWLAVAVRSPSADNSLKGETSQREPITAVVRSGRMMAFDTTLRQRCTRSGESVSVRLPWRATVPIRGSDGQPTFARGRTVWQRTWRPALRRDRTIRDLGSVAPANDASEVGPNAATTIVTAHIVAGQLNGSFQTSILLEEGFYCQARAEFTLPLETLRGRNRAPGTRFS